MYFVNDDSKRNDKQGILQCSTPLNQSFKQGNKNIPLNGVHSCIRINLIPSIKLRNISCKTKTSYLPASSSQIYQGSLRKACRQKSPLTLDHFHPPFLTHFVGMSKAYIWIMMLRNQTTLQNKFLKIPEK